MFRQILTQATASRRSVLSAGQAFQRRSYAMTSIPIPNDFNKGLYTSLKEEDPEIQALIDEETSRQFHGIELIASENLTSRAAIEANASLLINKYSEGLPGARYYGGNEVIDKLEVLCQERALKAFNLDPKVWGVNVQPYAGSTANFAAFTALIKPGDRLMGLGLPSGGHLTHGAYTAKRKISASSIYFEPLPYRVDTNTGYLNYEELEDDADRFNPRLLVCGASAYPRDWDYNRLRQIADKQSAYLMMDMAHISGLVAAQVQNNPFEHCDVVTTTTHKTLRGPRAGLIFFRKDKEPELETRINNAVFPGCQGGPHNQTIASIAVALKQAATPAFKEYATQVIANSRALGKALLSRGNYRIQTDGSDNHLLLWDLRPMGITGSKVEKVCDLCHITLNKNAVVGDKSAQVPGGIRVGTPALTSRSMREPEMEKVADFLHRAVQISVELQNEAGSKKLNDFIKVATQGDSPSRKALTQLSEDVKAFATSYPLPGVPDTTTIKPLSH